MRDILTEVKRRLKRGTDARTDGGTATAEASDGTSLLRRDSIRSAPFWLPPFLLMGLFVYGGILWNFVISLTNVSGFAGLRDPSYADLDFENYIVAFTGGDTEWSTLSVDPIWEGLWTISPLRNTIVLLIAFTLICLVLGLLLAILVDQKIRFENTFRTIYLLPMSLSFVVTAKFWQFMYNEQSGVINLFLEAIGVGAVGILQSSQFKLAAVTFALIWQFSGYAMVVYLAGLRAIPTSHFEAARVDGASTVRMYWRIIVPQLRTATVSAVVVLMVFALKAFDFLYSLYGGPQPGPSADILATQMFREAYSNSNYSYGAAIAIILFVMALAIVAPYIYSQYRRGDL